MTTTSTTDNLANVPHPADATEVTEWVDRGTPDVARFFSGTSRVVEREHRDILINIDGAQYGNGAVRRMIVLIDSECDAWPLPRRTRDASRCGGARARSRTDRRGR